MALIVQKYGGTSVGNPDRIKNVAARVAKYHAQSDKIVVVVSAMSGVTDGLIKLAKDIAPLPSEREMDMLLATGEQQTIALTAIALHTLGVPAVSMTGAQAGIMTDGVHTKAKIHNITPKQVHEHLDAGKVVIVAGFQGETAAGQITTLGLRWPLRSRPTFARFIQMWTVFIRPTRASCRRRKSFRKFPTTKCSNSPALVRR
jgi:aspartate kinase